MKQVLSIVVFALAAWSGTLCGAETDAGWESLFDGKSLDGWDGNPKFWSVRDGAITGQTTPENPTKGNTFIIWRKGDVGDFEAQVRVQDRGGELRDSVPQLRGAQ